jgi:hypothetical protein
MGRLTEFFRAGFNEKQVNALKNITAYPYIAPAGDGKVFYVDPGASASGSGSTPETAFATLAEAIDAAVTGRGDIILCLPGTETLVTADAPIVVDKAGLTIATVPHLSDMNLAAQRYKLIDATDEIILSITKPCHIIGIDVQITAANATAAAIHVDTVNGTGTIIENCTFIAKNATFGIGISLDGGVAAAGGAVQIKNCIFSALAKGVEFHGTTNSIGDIIDTCFFMACTAGIYWTTNTSLTLIKGNTFSPANSSYYACNFNGVNPGSAALAMNIVDNTLIGESLSTCFYYSAAVTTYAAYAAVYINFVGNQYQKSNSDVYDGWNLTATSAKAANGTVALFNVSIAGLVEAKIFGKVTTALTTDGATKTLVVGTAGATSSFVNVTDATTNSTIGDVVAGTSATAESAALPDSILASGAAAAVTAISSTGGANVTGGTITWYCMWRPIIAGSTVVAA